MDLEVREEIGRRAPDHHDAEIAALSDRQRQIAAHLARGSSSKLIAYQLGISLSTVTTHVRRLASKFNSENRVQLVAACQMYLTFDPTAQNARVTPAMTAMSSKS